MSAGYNYCLSAGVVGNQEIGDYQFAANVSPTSVPHISGGQETIAYYIQNQANPDLKWERTASYNAGISSEFFNSRLTVTLDAYYKKTTDLLLQVPVEHTTGHGTPCAMWARLRIKEWNLLSVAYLSAIRI